MTKFKQIENVMENLLDKLPEDERIKVDPQIYYSTSKNNLSYMLGVNNTSPRFWMYYDPNKGAEADFGAIECWIKKDGTIQGAIFHDCQIEPIQEFGHVGQFNGDLAEFVRMDLIDTGRLTKLREGVDYYIVLVMPDNDDLHNAYAVRFNNLEDAEEFLLAEDREFRNKELLTENEFLLEWSKPADTYNSEEEAAEDDCFWCDSYERWFEIPLNEFNELDELETID